MTIRKAKIKDLQAIVDIHNQAILAGQMVADITPITLESKKQWFHEHREEKYPILVAERNNKIMGYLSISPYRPGRMALRYTAEVSYYVDFDYHRQGVATNLLKKALEICPDLEINTVFSILIDINDPSINLLKKFGFEKWGHLPRIAVFDKVEVGHYYYGKRIIE